MKHWTKILVPALVAALLAGCAGAPASAQTPASQSVSAAESQSEGASYAVDPAYDGQDAPVDFSGLTAHDMDGNEVDASLFADYKLTVVNVWATYCGPCLQEMPDLGELAGEYAEKGVQVVGVVGDVLASDGSISQSQMEKAAQIIEQTGADYLHIPMDLDLYQGELGTSLYAFPTTYFVDSQGRPVGNGLVGMVPSKEAWQAYIDAHLDAVEQAVEGA